MNNKLFSLIFALFVSLLINSPASAQSISAAQLAQFKQLPAAEQEALAKSYGISLPKVNSSSATNSAQKEAVSGLRKTLNTGNNGNEIEKVAKEGTDGLSLGEDKEKAATREKLKLYGYDIFNSSATTFVPATDIPVPSNYVLGPGDTLIIQLYGKENELHTLAINREGQIQFPGIGPVALAGLSFNEVTQRINQIVSEQMIGIKSSITLGSLRSIRVFVLGEAALPGSYVIHSLSTLTNAIMASGGITKIGSLRNIQLKRQGEVVTTFDLYDLLMKGDTSKDVRLLPGDVIFIPTIGQTVSVSGEVKRPAIYELKGETTVKQTIKLAGGVLPTAYLSETRIERITDDGEKTLLNIDASKPQGLAQTIKDADVIQVFSTLDEIDDIVLLTGHVKRPGGFKWKPNLRFTDIVPSIEEMSPNPETQIAVIKHLDPKTREVSISHFSPLDAWNSPKSNKDPLLNSRDSILLFSIYTDRSAVLAKTVSSISAQSKFNSPKQIVRIGGQVHSIGTYPLLKDMTAKDLILLAGGMRESSSGINAEITRQIFDHEHNREQKHIFFDLRTENPKLLPGDSINIKQIPYWKETKKVSISGEVESPGTYTVLPGETITQAIKRAGSFTPYAFIEGTTYSRADLRSHEARQIEMLKADIQREIMGVNLNKTALSQGVTEIEASMIMASINQMEAKGYLVINMDEILEKPDTLDFELEDGDHIHVPKFKPTVTVVGEVQLATSHFHEKGSTLNDYLKLSGGTNKFADKKRIYVVRANGEVVLRPSGWFKRKNIKMYAGDTVIVPIDASKSDPWSAWESFAKILGQTALGIAALHSL